MESRASFELMNDEWGPEGENKPRRRGPQQQSMSGGSSSSCNCTSVDCCWYYPSPGVPSNGIFCFPNCCCNLAAGCVDTTARCVGGCAKCVGHCLTSDACCKAIAECLKGCCEVLACLAGCK